MNHSRHSFARAAAFSAALAVLPSSHAVADEPAVWNAAALKAAAASGLDGSSRAGALALLHAALSDAAGAVTAGGTPFAFSPAPRVYAGASADASMAQAGHDVLVRLFPSQRATLDAALQRSLAAVADGPAKAKGLEAGRAAAAAALWVSTGGTPSGSVADLPPHGD